MFPSHAMNNKVGLKADFLLIVLVTKIASWPSYLTYFESCRLLDSVQSILLSVAQPSPSLNGLLSMLLPTPSFFPCVKRLSHWTSLHPCLNTTLFFLQLLLSDILHHEKPSSGNTETLRNTTGTYKGIGCPPTHLARPSCGNIWTLPFHRAELNIIGKYERKMKFWRCVKEKCGVFFQDSSRLMFWISVSYFSRWENCLHNHWFLTLENTFHKFRCHCSIALG